MICLAHCCEAQLPGGPRDVLGIKSGDKCCILAANSAEAAPGSVGMGGRPVVPAHQVSALTPRESTTRTRVAPLKGMSPSSQKPLRTSRKAAWGPPACSSPTRALSALPRTRHPTTGTAASGSDSPKRHHFFPCLPQALRLVSPASLCRLQILTCPQSPAQPPPPLESLLRSTAADTAAPGMGRGPGSLLRGHPSIPPQTAALRRGVAAVRAQCGVSVKTHYK